MIDTEFFNQLNRFSLMVRKRVSSVYAGSRRAVLQGKGIEIVGYREYMPGDDIRTIDWRVYGRTEKLYIRKFEEEKNVTTHILLDSSKSMDYSSNGMTKFDYAAMLACGFGYLVTRENEKFGISTLNREELEDEGLRIAKSVAERSDSYEIRYAEHPYVHARFEGYRVDLVPCYRLSSASELKSAVDRTPFHNKYILSKIGGLEDDVLLLKQFMKRANVYGSELRVCGFSGFLCELLILHYGSFQGVLDAACDWRDGLLIEPGGSTSQRSQDAGVGHGGVWEPLCMIDPTDPHRNVAAALSLDQFYVFVDAARGFLAEPSIGCFFAEPAPRIDKPEMVAAMEARGTDLLAIVFEIPDMVEDIAYPQLYKMRESVLALLSEHEFTVLGSAASVLPASKTTDTVVLLIELMSGNLPPLRKHAGPPAYMRKHAERFKMKLVGEDTFSNVYIEDGRYVVDLCRTYRSAKDLLESELHSRALGKQLRKEAREGYAVLEGRGIVDAVDLAFLSRYFKK